MVEARKKRRVIRGVARLALILVRSTSYWLYGFFLRMEAALAPMWAFPPNNATAPAYSGVSIFFASDVAFATGFLANPREGRTCEQVKNRGPNV